MKLDESVQTSSHELTASSHTYIQRYVPTDQNLNVIPVNNNNNNSKSNNHNKQNVAGNGFSLLQAFHLLKSLPSIIIVLPEEKHAILPA